jgi:hypothetical protein
VRVFVKVSVPVEAGNAGIRDGSLPKRIKSILAEQKPEAAYFYEEDGKRTFAIFLDVRDPSQIPEVAEPWFLAFNARLEFHPAMILADLEKAGPGIEKAVKKYG